MDYEQRQEMGRNFVKLKYTEEMINLYSGNNDENLEDFYQRQISFHEELAESYRNQLTNMGVTEEQLADLEEWHKKYKASKGN